ncbi:hypothetical protein FRACYDRAFT_267133 [Fragilariopsis cylindrus CCMP1102]|uniref:Transmembrane protein n=1 Tax=Fragilariopsis cylindrus CCMP1102 TaxID=635003 RepID=A0A1E7FW61_9STRA|nr:hypothetical protein FRACYDRAFT_267133 [Fragilariopsis cylindrus CCMP1102]|eukprot:OEU22043.1 hypothetical protein FRACYDRAFT_267133 [Fragilariopsis cylindrus CCMP1102]
MTCPFDAGTANGNKNANDNTTTTAATRKDMTCPFDAAAAKANASVGDGMMTPEEIELEEINKMKNIWKLTAIVVILVGSAIICMGKVVVDLLKSDNDEYDEL